MTKSPFSALRKIVDEAKPAMSTPPTDCTGDCGYAPCNCSGEWRVAAWHIDLPALQALLKDAE